jgi:hypothetical protein
MIMRRSLTVALAAGAVIGATLAPAAAFASTGPVSHRAARTAPNSAGGDPNTTMTFTVTVVGLTMTAPGAANIGSGAPGTTISGPLGTVTVTDARALISASWTATASSTNFTTGGGTPAETIPATDANYNPGPITTTGTITATGSDITLSNAAQTVVAGTAGSGDNTASWDPTIAVAVPATAVGGLYTATLTQSVS